MLTVILDGKEGKEEGAKERQRRASVPQKIVSIKMERKSKVGTVR